MKTVMDRRPRVSRRLVLLRKQLGMTRAALAQAAAVNRSQYGALESGRGSPLKGDGVRWVECALRVAAFHGVSPEWIWQREVGPIRSRAMMLEANASERISEDPSQRLVAEETARELTAWKVRLTDEESAVIRARFEEGKSLRDVDHRSRERIRQIEVKALRKLRDVACPTASYRGLASQAQIDVAMCIPRCITCLYVAEAARSAEVPRGLNTCERCGAPARNRFCSWECAEETAQELRAGRYGSGAERFRAANEEAHEWLTRLRGWNLKARQ